MERLGEAVDIILSLLVYAAGALIILVVIFICSAMVVAMVNNIKKGFKDHDSERE